MPSFNFNTFTSQNVLKQLLDTIPISVTSYNFLIIGNTIIIPLGVSPKNTYSTKMGKKDLSTSEAGFSLTSFKGQDRSSIITQRQGNQIRISSEVSLELFNKLFNFTNQDFIIVSASGVIDAAFQFAYDNFESTNCILVDSSGVRGAGGTSLKISDWNRTLDINNSDIILLDVQFSFEKEEKKTNKNKQYEISENDIKDILSS